jgi:hypothetical protein
MNISREQFDLLLAAANEKRSMILVVGFELGIDLNDFYMFPEA